MQAKSVCGETLDLFQVHSARALYVFLHSAEMQKCIIWLQGQLFFVC